MSFTIWPHILNSSDTRYCVTTLYPQQYNVLTKQIDISNPGLQRKSPATATSTDKKQNKATSDVVKNIKEKSQEELQDLVKECINKWKENVSFCLVCNVECGNIDLLEEHKNKDSFICRICTVEFKNHADLETHFFTHKPFKCYFCQEICFSKSDLSLHKKNFHQNDRFQCDVCNSTFSRRKTLKAHKTVKHSDSNISLNCVVCEKMFPTKSQLRYHSIKVHNAFEYQECKFCNSLFSGPDNLKTHIKSKHLESARNTLLGCKLCGKLFKGLNRLSQHERTHDNTECVCELCGQSVKESAIKTHMNLKHSKKKFHHCKFCIKQFAGRSEMEMHCKKCPKKIRTTPDPVFCEICGKQYKNMSILRMHKKIHCEERPYKCEECGASFRQSVTLNTHSRVHSSVGKYCCDDCGMTFKWKQTYDKHGNKCMGTNQYPKEKTSE